MAKREPIRPETIIERALTATVGELSDPQFVRQLCLGLPDSDWQKQGMYGLQARQIVETILATRASLELARAANRLLCAYVVLTAIIAAGTVAMVWLAWK